MTTLPLSSRVSAPVRLERPPAGDGITWRAVTMDDVALIHECERQIAAADHPHFIVPAEEISDDLAHSYVDLAADTIIAVDAAGRALAWGLVLQPPGQDTLVRSFLQGGVIPDYRGRGLGRVLLSWQEQRGLQQLAESEKTLPGWLVCDADDRAVATKRLIERFGFTPARYFLELARPMSAPVEPVALDDALTIVQFTPERSEATRLARNDSFRDHWGSQSSTREQWDSFVVSSLFRADLSYLALATTSEGEEIVAGLVLASVNEEDWPGQGFSSAYINLVGVRREWRRRSIAPALLTRSLEAIAAAGLDAAVLDVDSDSPTGALGLYTGLGFAESNRSITYNRVY